MRVPLTHLIVENLPGCNCIVYFWELMTQCCCVNYAPFAHRDAWCWRGEMEILIRKEEREQRPTDAILLLYEWAMGWVCAFVFARLACMWASEGCKWVTDRFEFMQREREEEGGKERLTHISASCKPALDGRTWGVVVCRAERWLSQIEALQCVSALGIRLHHAYHNYPHSIWPCTWLWEFYCSSPLVCEYNTCASQTCLGDVQLVSCINYAHLILLQVCILNYVWCRWRHVAHDLWRAHASHNQQRNFRSTTKRDNCMCSIISI